MYVKLAYICYVQQTKDTTMRSNLTNIEFKGVLNRSTIEADGDGVFTLYNDDEIYGFVFTYDANAYRFISEGFNLPTHQLDELEGKIQNFSESMEVEEETTDAEDMEFTQDCLRDPHLYI